MSSRYDFQIEQGATFSPVLRYTQPHLVVKTITGITKSAQAVVTAASHGLTVDWPVYITGVVGMGQINHDPDDLKRPAKAYQAYYVSANSMRLNLDSSSFNTYTSGGELVYRPPFDLTGYTARMQIRETLESTTTLEELTTSNGGITLGGTAGTITLLLTATETAALTFETAVYDLEIVSGAGVVTRLMHGKVVLVDEVTR